jgi:hypothetical protein
MCSEGWYVKAEVCVCACMLLKLVSLPRISPERSRGGGATQGNRCGNF